MLLVDLDYFHHVFQYIIVLSRNVHDTIFQDFMQYDYTMYFLAEARFCLLT